MTTPAEPEMDDLPPPEVLSSYGVTVLEDLGGRRNRQWVVDRGGSRAVLRRYPQEPYGDVSFEISVLERLHRVGWPVPYAVDEVEHHFGRYWAIFRWLPGRQRPDAGTRAEQRSRGHLLAGLHQALLPLDALGQRAGCVESHEVVADLELDGRLAAYEQWFPAEARVLRWHLERARLLFDEIDLDRARRVVLHSDFASWNLLYEDETLTGVLDFETTHRNFLVADFALSWRGTDDDVIHAYDEVTALDEVDRALLVPVFWSWMFRGVASAIGDMQSGQTPPRLLRWPVGSLLKRSPLMGPEAAPYRS